MGAAMTVTTARQTCEQTVNFYPGDYRMEPVACMRTIGLRSHLDRRAIRRFYCRDHEATIVARWGRLGECCIFCGSRQAIADGIYTLVTFEGGTVPVCDICGEKADQ